jgi:hypothetical protein
MVGNSERKTDQSEQGSKEQKMEGEAGKVIRWMQNTFKKRLLKSLQLVWNLDSLTLCLHCRFIIYNFFVNSYINFRLLFACLNFRLNRNLNFLQIVFKVQTIDQATEVQCTLSLSLGVLT